MESFSPSPPPKPSQGQAYRAQGPGSTEDVGKEGGFDFHFCVLYVGVNQLLGISGVGIHQDDATFPDSIPWTLICSHRTHFISTVHDDVCFPCQAGKTAH